MRFYLLVLAIAGIGIAASTALAQQSLRNDPDRPVAAIAADLDIAPAK